MYKPLLNDVPESNDSRCPICSTECQPNNSLKLPKCQHVFHLQCLLLDNLQNPSICPRCSVTYNKLILTEHNDIETRVMIKNYRDIFAIGFSHFINGEQKGYSFTITIIDPLNPIVVDVGIKGTKFYSYVLKTGNKIYFDIPNRATLKTLIDIDKVREFYTYELNPQIKEKQIKSLNLKAIRSETLTIVGKIILKEGFKENEFPVYEEIGTVVKSLPSRNPKSIFKNLFINKRLLKCVTFSQNIFG